MSNRICCLNPSCKRTAAEEKHLGSDFIVCAKCWRAMPRVLKDRWKLLQRRGKRLRRMGNKPSFARPERTPQWNRLVATYNRSWAALEAALTLYWTAGPAPVGIEDFLKENGIV